MKFKLSAAAIVVASVVIIGLMYLAVEKISLIPNTPQAQQDGLPQKNALLDEDGQAGKELGLALQPGLAQGIRSVCPEDEKIIKGIAALSEAELVDELAGLKKRIEKENLFAKLEQGRMDSRTSAEAKALLERFTLLGLEGTRRKYLPLEPELGDAVYAHRDSLKDIRDLMSRY